MEQTPKPIPNLFGTSFDGIISGVYKITSPIGKVYIGESKNIYNRWKQYKWKSCSQQRKLYDSLVEYGVHSHKFEIIHILNIETTYVEYIHRPKLHALEVVYISQYDDFENDLLNLHKGGKNKYYTNKYGKKTRLETPKIVYEIYNPIKNEVEKIINLTKFIEKYSIGCSKKLTSTLYGYDRLGNKNIATKGFKILSKTCVDDVELNNILQDAISIEKNRRYEIRLSKNIVDLGSPEYSVKCSNIPRNYIYTYIDLKTLKIGTIENIKKFCREHEPKINDDKHLMDTLYGINCNGDLIKQCCGVKLISKRFRDTTKDASIIDKEIEEIKNKRFEKRNLKGKVDAGSPEHLSKISKNSTKYIYTIYNVDTKKTFIVDNVSQFMTTYTETPLPKNFTLISSTIYQYNAIGKVSQGCKNFVTLEQHYIDKNLDDNLLQERIHKKILSIRQRHKK